MSVWGKAALVSGKKHVLVYGAQFSGLSPASSTQGGWQFAANSAVKLVGLRGMPRSSTSSMTLLFGTSGGTVLRRITGVRMNVNEWTEVFFDEPLTLTAGSEYVVQMSGNMNYARSGNVVFNSAVTYRYGRYGSFPGYTETGIVYTVDIIMEI